MKLHLENSFYFLLVVRLLVFVNCVVILLCVAFTDGWLSRISAVFGLVSNIMVILFIGCSIATLFTWDLAKMGVHKRAIFTFTSGLFSCLAGALFIAAQNGCDVITQYGCESRYPGGAFKVASTFSFLNLVFCAVDVGLIFFFSYFHEKKLEEEEQEPIPAITRDKTRQEIFREYQRAGQITSV